MSERRQRIKPAMVSPTLPPFIPYGLGQFGASEYRPRYLFGTDEDVLARSPEAKYRPSSSPPERPPNFVAIKAGPTSKDLNKPGEPTMYGPSRRFSKRTY